MRKIDLTNFQVATSETARQINRRIALNFIRRHTPMSRADLARRSGLQRSTVSAIVDQLIHEGWVTEGAVGHAPRGRRPRFLHLNVERAGIVAVELRPETTTIGLADVDARFVEQSAWPTPHTPEAFVRKLARAVATMRRAHPQIVCEGVGISLPGRVSSSGRLVFAPNLRWGDVEQGPPCPCGKRGCWERYASNSAAVQHYVHGPSSAVGDIPRFEDLLRFADHGDQRAVQALERMARFLGFGLAGLAIGLAPQVIVMIGEITAAWDRLGPIVLDEVKKRSLPHVETRIVPTDPSTQPRLRGAVTLVVQQHFGAPSVA